MDAATWCSSIAAMIRFDKVSKTRGGRRILEAVSFEALPGRVTGFVGPNGAGKSSSLRILLGLDRATAGGATIDGRAYRDLRHPLRHVGSMLDGAAAHPSRTARAHLCWVAASNGIPASRVPQVLQEVGLAADAHRRVGSYSLGMGQRLGLATALLGEPQQLVLDEPVNGLDPQGVRWIRQLLRAHADAGGTVLLSSHLIGELAEIVDDVVVIAEGRIRAQGSIEDVQAGYPSLEEAFFAHVEGRA